MTFEQWNGFVEGDWQSSINVRDFIDKNYTPYEGDDSFLQGPTDRTKRVFEKFEGFPEIEYWTSGCARDPFSHNQGLAGIDRKDNFWPSTYYKFNSISKKYEELAVVDSWSFWEYPTNIYDNNKPFPKELDIVGDGYLYLIMQG